MVLWTDIAKTRGVGSQGHDRTRSMASVRRRDRGDVEDRIGVDNEVQEVDHGEEFPRGPFDMSLLVILLTMLLLSFGRVR